MIDKEILTNNYELEKIIQTLILIKVIACLAVIFFYSTLVLASSIVVHTWIWEIYTKFGNIFSVILFYKKLGAEDIINLILKKYLVNL